MVRTMVQPLGPPAVFTPFVTRRRYNTHLTRQYRPPGFLLGLPGPHGTPRVVHPPVLSRIEAHHGRERPDDPPVKPPSTPDQGLAHGELATEVNFTTLRVCAIANAGLGTTSTLPVLASPPPHRSPIPDLVTLPSLFIPNRLSTSTPSTIPCYASSRRCSRGLALAVILTTKQATAENLLVRILGSTSLIGRSLC